MPPLRRAMLAACVPVRSRRRARPSLALSISEVGGKCTSYNVLVDPNWRLDEVLAVWACGQKGAEARWRLAKGSCELDLKLPLAALQPQLTLCRGRYCIEVELVVPLEATSTPTPRSKRVASSTNSTLLSRLRPSSRYACVDGRDLGLHRSSTYEEKRRSGAYAETDGQFGQKEFVTNLSTAPPSSGRVHSSLTLCTFKGAIEDMRVQIKGPTELLDGLRAAWSREDWKSTVYPVFVPTRGRADCAHLNFGAPHAFGADHDTVILACIEPAEEAAYRAVWSDVLLLVLPSNDLGAGFVRYVAQAVATEAYEPVRKKWQVRRLPYCWLVDDGISSFYRLDLLSQPAVSSVGGPPRTTQRAETTFAEAFLALQRHPVVKRSGVSGFLRDDGTCTTKEKQWTRNSLSVYKVVLLNLRALKFSGVWYLPCLRRYEDIALAQACLRANRATLKCQVYTYRARGMARGGASSDRGPHGTGTRICDLTERSLFEALPREAPERRIVEELVRWAQSKELAARKRQRDFSSSSSSTSSCSDNMSSSSSSSSSSTCPSSGRS